MGILIGIVTSIVLIFAFLWNAKKITNKKLACIILLLILGGIGSYICYRFEMHYGGYFKKVANSNYFEILFYAIFGVAIFEEGYKWFITCLVSFFYKSEDSYDIVSYSIFASIGFLTFENLVYYIIPYGTFTAISRIYTSVLSHICFAIIMGFFLQKGILSKKKYLYYVLGLIVSVFVHAFYNSFLYGGKYSDHFFIHYIVILLISGFLFFKMNYPRYKKDCGK